MNDAQKMEQTKRFIEYLKGAFAKLSVGEQAEVLAWLSELRVISESGGSAGDKARAAQRVTRQRKAVWPITKAVAGELKRLGWDERGWGARLGLSGVLAGVIFGGGAGIAAFGGAIGVSLWIVFGLGGAAIGGLIDELMAKKTPSVEAGKD